MKYDPQRHHRRSIRLKGYDYSQAGAYFVTIVTQNKKCFFGDIVDSKMVLNDAGRTVEYTWHDLPKHNLHIELDAFVIMPNHLHGIIIISDHIVILVGAGSEPAPTTTPKRHGLPEIIRQFKTYSSKRINQKRRTIGMPLWQRNYYEHIIRNEDELNRIREYIINNPLQWELDRENPLIKDKKQEIPWES